MKSNEIEIGPANFLSDAPLEATVVHEVVASWQEDQRLGAVVNFLGVVRGDIIGGSAVTSIEFSAHREMAEAAIDRLIRRECRSVISETIRVYLRHAIGLVPRGGFPVAIVVGTTHREEAFALAQRILEALKQEVPIYGREITASGGHSWKANR